MSGDSHASHAWHKLRNQRLALAEAANEPCCRCHQPIDYTLDGRLRQGPSIDHLHPLALGGELTPALDLLAPSHRSCNSSHGAGVGNRKRGAQRRAVTAGGFLVPTHPSPARIGNPSPIVEVGPRFLSGSSPDAVGSLWDVVGPWVADVAGVRLRPWQELVARRALEVDASGALCWRTVVVSTPRMSGKSWLLKAMALARASHPDLFGGEPQCAAHMANKHLAARRIHSQAWGWAERAGVTVRQATGMERLVWPDGGCWDVLTTANIYGASANLVLLDEVWDVSPEDYREGLRPTQVARQMPQLWAFSTAHRRATALMVELMAAGRAGAGRVLLADWGARPGQDVADPVVWDACAPHMDAQRRDEMSLMVGTPGFAEQWLNVWPDADDVGRWLPVSASRATLGRVGGVAPDVAVCGVECTPDGRRWAVAAAWSHGRAGVRARVWLLDSPGEVALVLGSRRVWAHPAVANHPALRRGMVEPVTVSVGRAATTELREAVLAGVLTVAGLPDEQWAAARTVPADGGEVIHAPKSVGDVHGLKALSWAVWAVQSERSHMGLVL